VSGRWNLKDAVFNGLGKREKRERREGKKSHCGWRGLGCGMSGRPRYFLCFPKISKVLVRKTANVAIAMYTKISEFIGL
jgi:hypothetical protein